MIPALELVELDRHNGVLREETAECLVEMIQNLLAVASDR